MKTYKVKRGKNRFQPWPLIPKYQTRPGKLYFEAVFDASCLYAPIDEEHDWNKLIGRAFDPVSPHNNSALVAWRCKDGKTIELSDYWHIGGKTIWAREAILSVVPGETVTGSIEHSWRSKRVAISLKTLDSDIVRRQQVLNSISCFTWVLQPWFGGTWPAPHDMKLNLKYE